MFYLLILPAFMVTEGIYLVKHPRTFSGLAAFVWAVISGVSFIFVSSERTLPLVPVTHVVGIAVYYFVKLHR